MIKVEFNKTNTNPFFGLSYCLNIQNGQIDVPTLNRAWNEVKEDKMKREMFFSLLFSVGDITNRQHNIFKGKKIDSGGNSEREKFDVILSWMFNNQTAQFKKFLFAHLFNEYQCFDTLFKNRVKTLSKTQSIITISSVFADKEYSKVLLDYVYSIIKGNNTFDKMLVAKFLTIPRTSVRQHHKRMLNETKQIMKSKAEFINALSKMLGWETKYFKGYREWRQNYNGNLESVLFSTGKINDLTKDEFIQWYDQLPALARARVRARVFESIANPNKLDSSHQYKWLKFQPWIYEWERAKELAQAEQRSLEEKIHQGQASEEDKIKLEKVKKEAKVTTGAVNFASLYQDIISGKIDKLKLESFIQNKVNLPYNSLVIIDDSGSMCGAPFRFASFLASVCLVKNPDDDARNLIGFFNNSSHWHSFIDQTSSRPNSLMRTAIAQTNKIPLVDGNLSFYDNYQRISAFCDAVFHNGGTDLSAIPRGLEIVIKENPEILDALKSYPIWTICSDGDLNSKYTARESMLDFQNGCRRILGYVPFVVMIEIQNYGSPETSHFTGIENFMYINSNPAQIEQFLTNFKDMDIMDVYTPLQSIYRSNRYELVRANTL